MAPNAGKAALRALEPVRADCTGSGLFDSFCLGAFDAFSLGAVGGSRLSSPVLLGSPLFGFSLPLGDLGFLCSGHRRRPLSLEGSESFCLGGLGGCLSLSFYGLCRGCCSLSLSLLRSDLRRFLCLPLRPCLLRFVPLRDPLFIRLMPCLALGLVGYTSCELSSLFLSRPFIILPCLFFEPFLAGHIPADVSQTRAQ